MKLHKLLKLTCLLVISCTLASCSGDDNNDGPACRPTAVSMVIDGHPYTFQAGGRGIDLRSWGYELHLNFYGDSENPLTGGIFLKMPYKKRGHNVFTEFEFGNYSLVNEDLHSEVIINRSTCFYATFSGKFTNGAGEEMVITDGSISYEYDESFDE